MTTMAICSLPVVILLLVLKVETHPTTTVTTELPTNPTSNSSIHTLHDPSKHQGSSPEHGQHSHHGDGGSNHGHAHLHHVNKTLASLGRLIHTLLEKDQGAHIRPVVQTYVDCVNGCLHPKHMHPPPPDDRFDDHHGYSSDNHGHNPDSHSQLDDIIDGDDPENILLQVEQLVRTSNPHGSLTDHPNPEGGHHGNPNGQQAEDISASQHWMCSHACLINMGTLTVTVG